MNWFREISSGVISDWVQSGNELIWENQFWGYLWFGTIREWIDLGKSVMGLSLIGDNQVMSWFAKISFGVISDWGQSGNELIWENQFWGYLWLGTIREWTDLEKSVLELSLIGDNQGMNWFGKISYGVISDWDNQGMNWFRKISSGVVSDWGQSENELIWRNQFQGLLLWFGTISGRVDLGKSTQ